MAEPLKLPKKLKHDTIYEAVFEVRFNNSPAIPTASILAGVLWSRLKGQLPNTEEFPLARMPIELRNANEMLAYQPTHMLGGDGIRLALGQRVMSASVIRPYKGWNHFKQFAMKCIDALSNSGIDSVDRCSLKYTNVLPGKNPNDLGQLNVEFKMGSFSVGGAGTVLRTEIPYHDCITVVQVLTGATVLEKSGDPATTGVLLDVDTISTRPISNITTTAPDVLELLHTTEKEIYFSLLKPDTLQGLGPEW